MDTRGDATGRAPISLRVFGGLDLSGAAPEAGASITQSKRLALFAYLTLAEPRGLHRRDALLPLFWPELDQSHARAALRQSLYYLRKSLDVDVFVSEGDETIGVDPGAIDCDALAFEAALERGNLERALDLYSGDPFEGFHVPDIDPALDDWFHATRERWRAGALDAARELAERDLGEDPARAAEWARRALRLDPEDEEAARLRIRALDAAGDRLAAIRAYEAFAERLEEEYGLEPEPETRALVEEIRQRRGTDEEVGPPTAPDPTPAGPSTRRRWRYAAGLAGGAGLLAVTGWVAWGWTKAESEAGILDPVPEAPYVEPRLGGLHDARIAFFSRRDGNDEIYTINGDGTELRRLTYHPASDVNPLWLPDGRIVFDSDRSGSWDAYVMNPDGSGVRPVTEDPGEDHVVAVSPDGSTLAVVSDRDGMHSALYLADLEGTILRRLDDEQSGHADFSPDGKRLVFGSKRAAGGSSRNSELFVLDLERDGPPVRLTDAWSFDNYPDWSPDGRAILFWSGRDGYYNWEVYRMAPDGSDPVNLTRAAGKERSARWTPDGSRIVFESERGGTFDLYVMDADGSRVRRITRYGGRSPDVRGPLPRPAPCLVVNGDFEEVTRARRPPGSEAFQGVPGWRAHDPLFVGVGDPRFTNSPDVFTPEAGVPRNAFGYQFPFHGRNYAGFLTGGANPVGVTEALGGALRAPLAAGGTYEIRAQVSNGDRRADWNFLEVYLHSRKTGVSLRVDTLSSSVDETWVPLRRRITIAPGDTNAYDEIVFRGSYPRPKVAGYWYVDDVDVCPVE